ncbi:MAG TPA: bifunctional transaldolase/phosoglucose isomerase [Terriglobales bacterium]|nr:bifunctional transaldolase/phosoglucose isomerase [Terriglobales bacterium]
MQPAAVVQTAKPAKPSNPLRELQGYGQSVWLDYIRRSLLTSRELQHLIDNDGLRGVTSNPAIFEKAVAGSSDYSDLLQSLARQSKLDAKARYEILAIRDIQDAADLLLPVYQSSRRRDGYVSLEVSPYLANDTAGTLAEGRRLWKSVGRDNVMIKVPGTPEGIPAFRQLISEGINVNVTLLFSQSVYEKVAQAYIDGLEDFGRRSLDVGKVASVASFFISRIDSAVDALASAKLKVAKDPAEQALVRSILGKIAIANAKLTYQRYVDIFRGEHWEELAKRGAQTQRVLWASTGTKNPNYSDVIYVEELIGPETVNTMPPATLNAFRDHGRARLSLVEDIEAAHDHMDTLQKLGISMDQVTANLLDEGLKLFSDAFQQLLTAVEKSTQGLVTTKVSRQTYKLPAEIAGLVKTHVNDWRAEGKVRRLWEHDSSLWTSSDEDKWLGWLTIADDQLAHRHELAAAAEDTRGAGFSHILLLGMGGSSLCPEVLKMTFGTIPGYPELHVLDSTDPAQVKAMEKRVDLAKTLFLVSSKSGSTLEPNIFKQYFFERVKQIIGTEKAGSRFIAITDPGSKMEYVAQGDNFRHIFHGLPSIGGRYSALSDFGMVPAALMGLDTQRFLERTEEMVHACKSCVPVDDNPGVVLGIVLGTLATNGRDKVTIVASPGISDLGAWLEQLIAESTGKEGHGIIPVDREQLGPVKIYGEDRVFAYLRLESAPDPAQDEKVAALEQAGQPVVRVAVGDIYDLGQEFFRWEIATAVAGSIIGINAFNQPDVEASKIVTRSLTAEYERSGSLPAEKPILDDGGIQLFADEKNAAALAQAAGSDKSLVGYLRSHLNRLNRGDYFALLAYVPMFAEHERRLQQMRHAVRDHKHVATCLGFGPRFLHSTGQAYKGGSNSGVFLQVTCDDAHGLPVPGQKYTFGIVKAAQARGDLQVLVDRNRRALRVHIDADIDSGLAKLDSTIARALA